MSCSRVKHSVRLGGALYLHAYQSMMKNSNKPFRQLGPCCLSWRKVMQKALVAYLNVLQKVMETGHLIEKKNWFPDIEPLFKLPSYENSEGCSAGRHSYFC